MLVDENLQPMYNKRLNSVRQAEWLKLRREGMHVWWYGKGRRLLSMRRLIQPPTNKNLLNIAYTIQLETRQRKTIVFCLNRC
jgi:hypothetical protein